jgi:hypothetical protein
LAIVGILNRSDTPASAPNTKRAAFPRLLAAARFLLAETMGAPQPANSGVKRVSWIAFGAKSFLCAGEEVLCVDPVVFIRKPEGAIQESLRGLLRSGSMATPEQDQYYRPSHTDSQGWGAL